MLCGFRESRTSTPSKRIIVVDGIAPHLPIDLWPIGKW
jgi:hypothetical protein